MKFWDILANITILRTYNNNNGGTLPPHIAITGSRPDLVLINTTEKTVWLLELTVSFETNFDAAHTRKKLRYTSLAEDITEAGYTCNNVPFEIGSRGHVSLANKTTLCTMHSLCKPKTRLSKFTQDISKISLLCSYSIYLSRSESNWTCVEPLRARKWAIFRSISIYTFNSYVSTNPVMWEWMRSYDWETGLREDDLTVMHSNCILHFLFWLLVSPIFFAFYLTIKGIFSFL